MHIEAHMKKGELALKLEKLRLTFFASPTKGLIFYENLLLPKDEKGMNEEGFNNLRKSFQNSNKAQIALVEEVIQILKDLRDKALTTNEHRKFIEQYRAAVLDDVATYRIIAENQPDE